MNRSRTWFAAAALVGVLGAASGITASVLLVLSGLLGPMTMSYGTWAGAITGAVAGPFARRRAWVGAGLAGAVVVAATYGALFLVQGAAGLWAPRRTGMMATVMVLRPLVTFAAFALFPAIWSRLSPYLAED
ncbi:MAG: hypothetical protein HXY24_18945 [Rubrivivax sp.]|nr:hypothetical protein [Rubrivivax sp.]